MLKCISVLGREAEGKGRRYYHRHSLRKYVDDRRWMEGVFVCVWGGGSLTVTLLSLISSEFNTVFIHLEIAQHLFFLIPVIASHFWCGKNIFLPPSVHQPHWRGWCQFNISRYPRRVCVPDDPNQYEQCA